MNNKVSPLICDVTMWFVYIPNMEACQGKREEKKRAALSYTDFNSSLFLTFFLTCPHTQQKLKLDMDMKIWAYGAPNIRKNLQIEQTMSDVLMSNT